MALFGGWHPTSEQEPEHALCSHLPASGRGWENLLAVWNGETVKTNALESGRCECRSPNRSELNQPRWDRGPMLPRAWPSDLSYHR